MIDLKNEDTTITAPLVSFHINKQNHINRYLSLCYKYLQMQLNDQNRLIQMVLVPLYYQKLKEMKINSILHEELLVMIFSFLAIDPDRLTTEPELYGSWAKSYTDGQYFRLKRKELDSLLQYNRIIREIDKQFCNKFITANYFINKVSRQLGAKYSYEFLNYRRIWNIEIQGIIVAIDEYEPYKTLSTDSVSDYFRFKLTSKIINNLLQSGLDYQTFRKIQQIQVYYMLVQNINTK